MRKKILETRSLLSKDNKSLTNSLFKYDLPALIEKMKHKHTWVKGAENAMILMNSPDKQIVLTALSEGTEIKCFQSHDSIIFHIIEGKLKLYIQKKSVILDKGQLLTLQENIKYRLTNKDETVFLLTITSTNKSIQPIAN